VALPDIAVKELKGDNDEKPDGRECPIMSANGFPLSQCAARPATRNQSWSLGPLGDSMRQSCDSQEGSNNGR
jgi:hypothetical protein